MVEFLPILVQEVWKSRMSHDLIKKNGKVKVRRVQPRINSRVKKAKKTKWKQNPVPNYQLINIVIKLFFRSSVTLRLVCSKKFSYSNFLFLIGRIISIPRISAHIPPKTKSQQNADLQGGVQEVLEGSLFYFQKCIPF